MFQLLRNAKSPADLPPDVFCPCKCVVRAGWLGICYDIHGYNPDPPVGEVLSVRHLRMIRASLAHVHVCAVCAE
eukprot:COSAG01_NODE_15993_length_1279_cov_36.900847_1_plen_73_part_10